MVAEGLSAATINLRLCGIRKLVNEARENGLIDPAEAVRLTSVPGVPQNGVRLGTWLTREETQRLLAAVDRSELIGKRNFAILSVLCLCALRREELAKLDSGLIQLREGRWVFADLIGKRGRVRTVPIPAGGERCLGRVDLCRGDHFRSGLSSHAQRRRDHRPRAQRVGDLGCGA